MKCRDCAHLGWGDDEGTPAWGLCFQRTSYPDPDIDRSCSDFSPKKSDIFTILSMLQTENEHLRAELEQVKAERDAAVSWAQKYTESIDMPCVACKHNTGDYVCTAICGNCGPMGAESCKWEFDFSGELKED
nr:MAG TPA: hypothetical protein [Caudoviricetes sp.]